MSLNDSINNTLIFKKKSSRIDWRKIASVDLDRIARDLDVYSLQDNIDHITYCNIESELDTRLIDPNYIKLFKISQFTIEYLVHSQNYLTDVISSIETQLNTSLNQNEELKKLNDKLSKDLHDVKKENKKRKKMIETQQTLMSVTSANYHQCAYCSKVFLNVSYLQAHMTRRHADVDHSSMSKQAFEFEKELERIKERLRITESELIMERTSRLNLNNQKSNNSNNNEDLNLVIKKIEELKNNELEKQKEEFDKMRRNLRKEISELNDTNSKFEMEIKHLQESLSKKSSIGWIKDDVDLEKDNVLNMKKEIHRLNEIIANNEREIKNLNEQKSKLKTKENELKRKFKIDIQEKDDEIDRLKAKLAEMENSIGKSDNELRARINELQNELQLEIQMRQKIESELKNRPPSVTPRQQGTTSASQIITHIPQPIQTDKLPSQPLKSQPKSSIYLPDYCPLTLKELNSNPLHLDKFKKLAISLFEKELDEFGISIKDTRLSNQDFKLKMNSIKSIRPERADDMLKFNELRNVFNEISSKNAGQRLKSSIRSSKVHFKPEIKLEDDESTWIHDSIAKNNKKNDSETEEDVSLPEAFESDDDTEPTKSINLRQRGSVSPRKASKLASSINFDETSEFENVSQLTDSTRYKKNKSPSKKLLSSSQAKSSVGELAKKLERQLEVSMKKGNKPSKHAVPIGFKENSDENSLGSVSDLDESKSPRPRSGMRASFQDSNSSGLWVPESQSIDINQHVIERPPTANSTKTLNDTDDITNVD
ncbi:unnamed protein product [Brachionus calyciflorus]|uniref:C2H2-type domain-containing protein n=1 Tax=Brachionus calyciflorus TaxID=104777 RepID=A0A814BBY8_9BILA|nr:unnamed protein product [Brachionus calyciflorus]